MSPRIQLRLHSPLNSGEVATFDAGFLQPTRNHDRRQQGLGAQSSCLRLTMTTYRIDPLCDSRWATFIHRHPAASVFHTPGWLEALRRTYGYQPVVFSTSAPDQELRNGILFCEIHSFLTGRRLVSLPFADHCQPLVDDPEDLIAILTSLQQSPGKG